MANIVKEIQVEYKVPAGRKVHVVGDVSATNCLMEVFDALIGKTYLKVMHKGQNITDFTEVFNHLQNIGGYSNNSIENVVLSPAGPLNPDGTVKMTRAPFTIDAKKVHQPVAIPNDYAAKGYAVAVFGLDEKLESRNLKHLDGTIGERIKEGRIAILGPGTGLGCGRLQWDRASKLYFPLDSEGGHTNAIVDVDSDFEVGVMRILKRQYGGKIPHNEAICSGKGLTDVFKAIIEVIGIIPDDIAQYDAAEKSGDNEDARPAYIANGAKNLPNSIYGMTMDFMWKVYGRALRNLAVHENARGGIWVAAGIPRKNILKDDGHVNERIEELIMSQFDNGPSHSDWVNKIPIKVIMDPEDGLKGAKAIASNPIYMEREKYVGRN